LARPPRAERQNTREGYFAAGAAICEWTVLMTWRERARVVTSGECGPPVVQVVERNNAPSKDDKCARGNRHKHVAVASKAATSSTLSAYVRRGGQLAKAWVEEE